MFKALVQLQESASSTVDTPHSTPHSARPAPPPRHTASSSFAQLSQLLAPQHYPLLALSFAPSTLIYQWKQTYVGFICLSSYIHDSILQYSQRSNSHATDMKSSAATNKSAFIHTTKSQYNDNSSRNKVEDEKDNTASDIPTIKSDCFFEHKVYEPPPPFPSTTSSTRRYVMNNTLLNQHSHMQTHALFATNILQSASITPVTTTVMFLNELPSQMSIPSATHPPSSSPSSSMQNSSTRTQSACSTPKHRSKHNVARPNTSQPLYTDANVDHDIDNGMNNGTCAVPHTSRTARMKHKHSSIGVHSSVSCSPPATSRHDDSGDYGQYSDNMSMPGRVQNVSVKFGLPPHLMHTMNKQVRQWRKQQ